MTHAACNMQHEPGGLRQGSESWTVTSPPSCKRSTATRPARQSPHLPPRGHGVPLAKGGSPTRSAGDWRITHSAHRAYLHECARALPRAHTPRVRVCSRHSRRSTSTSCTRCSTSTSRLVQLGRGCAQRTRPKPMALGLRRRSSSRTAQRSRRNAPPIPAVPPSLHADSRPRTLCVRLPSHCCPSRRIESRTLHVACRTLPTAIRCRWSGWAERTGGCVRSCASTGGRAGRGCARSKLVRINSVRHATDDVRCVARGAVAVVGAVAGMGGCAWCEALSTRGRDGNRWHGVRPQGEGVHKTGRSGLRWALRGSQSRLL